MARVAAASGAIPAGSDRHLPRPVGSLERRSPRVHATHKAATLWDVQPLRTRLYEKTFLEPLTETEGIPGTCTPTHAGVGGAGHPRPPGPQLPRQPSGAGGGSEPPHPRLAPNISERHGSERRALGPTRAAARPRRELQFTAGLGDDAAGGAGGPRGRLRPQVPLLFSSEKLPVGPRGLATRGCGGRRRLRGAPREAGAAVTYLPARRGGSGARGSSCAGRRSRIAGTRRRLWPRKDRPTAPHASLPRPAPEPPGREAAGGARAPRPGAGPACASGRPRPALLRPAASQETVRSGRAGSRAP